MTLKNENPRTALMPLDTVKLRSPPVDVETFQKLERQCVLKQAIQLESGQVLYQLTTGSLRGSWDSRISIRPMRQEWRQDKTGRVCLCDALPYVVLECSTAKVLFGHNVYGGPVDFQRTMARIVQIVASLVDVLLPPANDWIVHRVDWAESFALPYIAIEEYFRQLQTTYFPRRKAQKYGDHAIYFPGCTTTLKLYHKGREFAVHDYRRLLNGIAGFDAVSHTSRPAADNSSDQRGEGARRKVVALQRLANNRMRVEVEVHADKLDFDFGRRPTVDEVSDNYLAGVFDYELDRFLREGRDSITLARTNLTVADRLVAHYGETRGNRLHAFWCQLAASGEAECRMRYPPATFYRNRRMLQDAGVSWHNTDVQILAVRNQLPTDFAPVRLDPRRCTSGVRLANVPSLMQMQCNGAISH